MEYVSSPRLYDELATECGEVCESSESMKIIEDASEVEKVAQKSFEKVNQFAYGGDCPMPGEAIADKISENVEVSKTDAVNQMIQQAALLKAEKEAEEREKNRVLSPEEKAERKKSVIDYLMYQQEEAYFTKYHYVMDGKTKRGTRKRLERMYDKGRFKNFGITDLNN